MGFWKKSLDRIALKAKPKTKGLNLIYNQHKEPMESADHSSLVFVHTLISLCATGP